MTPTDLPLLVLSIHEGKPVTVTSATTGIVDKASSKLHCMVINLGSTPPCVVSVYSNCRYPYFAGHLPDQFLDHLGNLRNAQGGIVFLAEGNADTTPLETGRLSPYMGTKSSYANWVVDTLNPAAQAQTALIGSAGAVMTSNTTADLSDMLSVLSPSDVPVASKAKRPFTEYTQVFKGK